MKILKVIFISISTACFASCNYSSTPAPFLIPGSWNKVFFDFSGDPRGGAVSFTIGDTAYVGTGFNYDNGRLKDFWKFDPVNNWWIKKTDFPGSGRSAAVAFSLNGKGYVGTGVDNSNNFVNDFYEFDPTMGSGGSWKRIADFPSARIGSLGFTVKNRAFVGCGHDSADLNDLWEYDQINDAWVSQGKMAGSKRQNGFVMVIGDFAYIGGGTNNAVLTFDFIRFDVTKLGNSGAWTMLGALTGKDVNGNAIAQPRPRELASTFTIDGKGYLICGLNLSSSLGDTWQYDPLHDTWTQYFSFTDNKPIGGPPRNEATAFALTTPSGTFGYLTTGGISTSSKFDDFWRFDPTGEEPDGK